MNTFEELRQEINEQIALLIEMGATPETVRLGYKPYGVIFRHLRDYMESQGEILDGRLLYWMEIPIEMVADDDLVEVIACLSHDS